MHGYFFIDITFINTVFHINLQMLLEVGYIAGQHELLSESLHKENYKNVREQGKKLREVRRRNMDEHKKHLTELKQVYHAMEKAKEKFRKAFEDQVIHFYVNKSEYVSIL